jgi:hypothetical protein
MHPSQATIDVSTTAHTKRCEWIDIRSQIRGLNSLAVRTLLALFDHQEQLFSDRFVEPEELFVEQGASRRGTLIALLGLRRIGERPAVFPFDFAAVEKAVFQDCKWMRGIGDLGLSLWYAALYAPEQLEKLYECCNFEAALDFSGDARESRTKELAWFLAGLSHAERAQTEASRDFTDLAVETYRKLSGNQGEDGIFSHWVRPHGSAGGLAAASGRSPTRRSRSMPFRNLRGRSKWMSHLAAPSAALWPSAHCKDPLGNGGGSMMRTTAALLANIRSCRPTRPVWHRWPC